MKVLDHDTGNLLRAVVQPHSEARGKTILELASKISRWEDTIAGARQHGIFRCFTPRSPRTKRLFCLERWTLLEVSSSAMPFIVTQMRLNCSSSRVRLKWQEFLRCPSKAWCWERRLTAT